MALVYKLCAQIYPETGGLMRLLLSSFQGIFTLDTDTEKLTPIHQARGTYFGLTWHDDLIYAVARNNLGDAVGKPELILRFNPLLWYHDQLPVQNTANTGFHGLMLDPDSNLLWITAPLQNKIILFDISSGHQEDFYPNDAVKSGDFNHFNSITKNNDEILVNAHNHGASQIFVINYDKKRKWHPKTVNIVQMVASVQSHDCFYFAGSLCTCDSNGGQVRNERGAELLPKKMAGYTRGIIISEDEFIVGESQRAIRDDRLTADGWIHVYDNDWYEKKVIHLPKIGQVMEIRALDAPDTTHNFPQLWQ